jgi:hypothetical protein
MVYSTPVEYYLCNGLYFFKFTVSSLVRKLKQQAREQMEERRPNLVSALNQMGDFYMELKWDFQSWGEHCISSLCEFMLLGIDIVQNVAANWYIQNLSKRIRMLRYPPTVSHVHLLYLVCICVCAHK